MEITKLVKPLIKRGWPNTFDNIVYIRKTCHMLQPKTGCPLKLSRAETGQYLDGRPPMKTTLLLEEVLVRPAACVGPNAPV